MATAQVANTGLVSLTYVQKISEKARVQQGSALRVLPATLGAGPRAWLLDGSTPVLLQYSTLDGWLIYVAPAACVASPLAWCGATFLLCIAQSVAQSSAAEGHELTCSEGFRPCVGRLAHAAAGVARHGLHVEP